LPTHASKKQTSHLHEVFAYAQVPLRSLAGMAGLLLLDAAASLLTPLVIGLVSAHILQQPGIAYLSFNQLLVIWAGLVLIQASLRYFSTQQLGKAASQVSAVLRSRTYEHIQALPLTFFHTREHGDILSLLSEDIRRVALFLTNTATEIAPHLLTVAGATIIVLSIDPMTGLGALCVMPLVLLTIRQAGRAANPLSRALADQQATHASLTEENLRLNQLIKSFAREQLEVERYAGSNTKLLEAELKHLHISNRIGPLVQAITGIAVILLVWIGAQRIQMESLQPSELVSLIMYGFILFRPLHALGRSYGSYQSARGAAARLTELLEEQSEPTSSGDTLFPGVKSEIRLETVRFAYPGRPDVLKSTSAVIPAGKVTALIGENGAGKTTLIHLLLRFMDPLEGRISVDGTDVRQFKLASIRAKIGYVPQHVALINGTIADNIRYGMPDADEARVAEAAHNALVTEFAATLPEGMATLVGPGGVKLSGGQKQRIALARALLKNAPIIILDEPTAMFDPESETKLLDRLVTLLAGKTVMIVTHRPAMLQLAHLSLRLSDGKLNSVSN